MPLQDGIHWREAGPGDGQAVLLVHGYPESSHMWRDVLPALADAGFRALAPDLPGYGDSPVDRPGTWERHVEALERFRVRRGVERAAAVLHDWGGMIGMRWACDHPDAVWALVVSASSFFADSKWHGMGDGMRTAGTGEQIVDGMTRDGLEAVLSSVSTGIDATAADEYFKAYADEPRRRAQLDLYRSGDWDKLVPYEGRLAALGVPFLSLWGGDDAFSSARNAQRFEREVPGARTVVLEGVGHFLVEDEPERYTDELLAFLHEASGG